MSIIVCRPKSLPLDKLVAAERRAIEINPDNEFEARTVERTPTGRRGGERRIVVVVARKWPASGVRLSVSFLDNPSTSLRSRILKHMNAWGQHANVLFSETKGVGKVRIARLDSPDEISGYWSYVGTEILDVDDVNEPTMNLDSFTMKVSESEFRRVVRHEAGHTLGFDHEHMRSEIVNRIDRKKAYAFYDKDQGWSKKEVDEQVLTPLAKRTIMGTTEADPTSIMCYQLPGKIMKDGKAVPGGADINPKDFEFAARIYPKKKRGEIGSSTEERRELPPPLPDTPPTASESSNMFEVVVMGEFHPDCVGNQPKAMPKFAQVFASYCGARVTSVMRLRADKGGKNKTMFRQIIDVHEQIKDYTNGQTGTLPDDDEMIEFGTNLFDTLFQGDVRRLYDEARTRQRGKLDLVLTSMIPWIAEKPWEFAYDKGRESFLATEEINFVRNVLTSVPADPVEQPKDGRPLRILVVSAQPVGFGMLSIDQEEKVIERGFEALVDAGLVEIKTLPRATPSMIQDHLMSESYNVVHFIGHGVYDEKAGEGRLIFVDESGGEYSLGERSVREIFRGRGLSLVFLNSCESGRGGKGAEFNKGIAQSLVARGLPALVANQYSVLDSSATSFAQHFYWCLAQGMSIGQSAREARIAVNYLLHGEPIDWAVPVVYARNPNAALCRRPDTTTRKPAASVARAARRATAGHTTRIAAWDMDEVFPALGKTLEAMNRSQGVFGFELANLSVPLGVWAFDKQHDKQYLWAEHLADRLQRMPMELGVEVLVCITRQWLRDDDYLNLYTWWPAAKTPPIIIYSVAGFDHISAEGPETDRALANAAVSGLAGFFGDIGSHRRPPKNCPLAFNEERDERGITEQLKFDAACRKMLKPKLGGKLEALEALLKTF
ncbi:MAG TPA: CHAT domain-containing protein [Pyrinomonadaceae bacterium]|nr:CHAT domain-containing protein [Pyrinomonadaceae bacterium]